MAEPFIGEIRGFGFNFAPRGWAHCNGQLLPIAQNNALFAVIGTTYGGDGHTTFALPNLQGQIPMHWGNGPGGLNTVIGQVQGQTSVTLTDDSNSAASYVISACNGHQAGSESGPHWRPTTSFSAQTRAELSTRSRRQ